MNKNLNYPVISVNSIKGELIGKGTDKLVYRDLSDPDRCLKVVPDNNEALIKKMAREVDYYKYLARKNIHPAFVPAFMGEFRGDGCIGFFQECFMLKQDGGKYDSVLNLYDYIETSGLEEDEINALLNKLRMGLYQSGVVVSDMHGLNILVASKNGISRMVIIDGYGFSEFIPLWKWIPILRRMKIDRQWKKFMLRFNGYMNGKGIGSSFGSFDQRLLYAQ